MSTFLHVKLPFMHQKCQKYEHKSRTQPCYLTFQHFRLLSSIWFNSTSLKRDIWVPLFWWAELQDPRRFHLQLSCPQSIQICLLFLPVNHTRQIYLQSPVTMLNRDLNVRVCGVLEHWNQWRWKASTVEVAGEKGTLHTVTPQAVLEIFVFHS